MAWLTRLSWLLGSKDIEANIAIVGLTGSGKTTIMRQLKPHEVSMISLSPTIPVAFHAEQFSYKTFTFVAFGLDEQDGFGNPWEEFYRHCHGIIFVVDSTDRLALPSAKTALEKLLNNPLLLRRSVPLLVLANKTDAPTAIPALQVSSSLGLGTGGAGRQLSGVLKPCQTVATDALTGEGFNEALDWLAHQLRRTRKLSLSLSLDLSQSV